MTDGCRKKMTLEEFRSDGGCRCSRGRLTTEERAIVVQQAMLMLDQHYVHLPMKSTRYAIDPLGRLRLLLDRVRCGDDGAELAEDAFQREMLDVFCSLRDAHTGYILPDYWANCSAHLHNLDLAQIWRSGERKYVVSDAGDVSDVRFVAGVELVHWNGVPIASAVANCGQRSNGSNADARYALALWDLTYRDLRTQPLPDEDWVVVGYRTTDGKVHELRIDWMIVNKDSANPAAPPAAAAMEDFLTTRSINAAGGKTIRHIQIYDFFDETGTFDDDALVTEFVRLVAELPAPDGLIVDVRGNRGGSVSAAERMLQTMTPRHIKPELYEFRNSGLNLALCLAAPPQEKLQPWAASIEAGSKTGSIYSAALPKSDEDACNSIGQQYKGPVVLLTDALTYSAADIFAAGFQDHEIGPVLGVDSRTGGGGANRWKYKRDFQRVPGYIDLPRGVDLNIALRRSLRVGRNAGVLVEDAGVTPDKRHWTTRNDVLEEDADLMSAAVDLVLNTKPAS